MFISFLPTVVALFLSNPGDGGYSQAIAVPYKAAE